VKVSQALHMHGDATVAAAVRLKKQRVQVHDQGLLTAIPGPMTSRSTGETTTSVQLDFVFVLDAIVEQRITH
jgi:hypothetical protein